MNTIPSIFNEKISCYTAVGNKERIASSGISAVVLNQPGLQRREFFQELEKTGFDNIISIESNSPHYDIQDLSNRFPYIRFILPEKEMNLGEQINLAVSEVESPLFFVFRSDMKIIAGGIAKRMAERLSITDEENDETLIQNGDKKTGIKRLCTVPVIMNSNYQILPTIIAPLTHRKKIRTALLEPQNEGVLSLYPFDGIGIYDRQRFINTGGFDITIKNAHWQLMDFGFRAFLWGEEISLNLHFKLSCDGERISENYSLEDCYRRFYLKNLAPVFRNDYAHLPLYRFPGFVNKTGENFFSAWEEFKESRKWVTKNKYRWKRGAHDVTSLWNVDSSVHDIQEK